MPTLKVPLALPHIAKRASSLRPIITRRSKSLTRTSGLTIDTDVWQPSLQHEPQISGHSSNASTESLATLSPSPPASLHPGDGETPEIGPFSEKIAAWTRDIDMPQLAPANLDRATISQTPFGARLAQTASGQQLLLTADPAQMPHDASLKDLLQFGMTRYATKLTFDPIKNKLVRTRMGGKKVALRSGSYAFVIDQDGDLLLSLTASAHEGAPAGAHLTLAAGLPVLFAGELTVEDGVLVAYTPQSGSYRTPECLRLVASGHPLLAAAKCNEADTWGNHWAE